MVRDVSDEDYRHIHLHGDHDLIFTLHLLDLSYMEKGSLQSIHKPKALLFGHRKEIAM